jgi:hypothetical protein
MANSSHTTQLIGINMLTQERLKELLHYNPETGLFSWLVNRARGATKGVIAGTLKEGRIDIMVFRKHYKAHRLAWLYVHGSFPKEQIDHINGNPSDNRLSNLREATHSENQQNIRRAQVNSKTGVLGVSPCRGKFQASIKANNKQYNLGKFNSIEEAKLAYDKKKAELHPFSVT